MGKIDKKITAGANAASLRSRAEDQLLARPRPLPLQSEAEMMMCISELEIHQLELKIQNDELRDSRSEVESCLNKSRQSEATIKRYAKRLILQEDDLRTRVSAELHDDIAQVLTALGLNLANMKHLLPDPGDKLKLLVEDSQVLTKEINLSVRKLMDELRPPLLDEFGLEEAIRLHANQCSRRAGIDIDVHIPPDLPKFTAQQETDVFNIFREALNNVVKHAAATKVSVFLNNHDRTALFSISDDGKGFLPIKKMPLPEGSGWGLTIMRERAELAGGKFWLSSALGKGTSIRVEIEAAPLLEHVN